MKILKITNWGEDKIIVAVEGYPHAQPTFDAKIEPKDLEIALKAWKINQDEVDAINNAPKPPPVKPDITAVTDLIGKEF